jgi:hypothetical protein
MLETDFARGTEPRENRHVIRLRLSESDFRELAGLATYHRRPIADLLCDGLPRIIEKYRVLKRLGERGVPAPPARRAFVTGSSQSRHPVVSVGSQPSEEEKS